MPPAIAWEVSRVLKVTTQAGATASLLHGEFCEYGIHMEWFQGTLFFMRGWEDMVNKLRLWKDDISSSSTSTSTASTSCYLSHLLHPAGHEVQAPWHDGGEVIMAAR
jgi:hypothetical protein